MAYPSVTNSFTNGSTSDATQINQNFNDLVNAFNSALDISMGDAAFSGTLDVTGDVAVNTNKLTVAGATGNTVIAGTLGVTGAVTLSSTLTDGTLTLNTGAITGCTSCTVDNLVINGNDISSSSGNLTITPVAGSNITLDGAVTVDAGVVAGITSLTATSITGTLATAAQGNVTSLGTLTALQVDNLNVNGNTISSTSGNINISPIAGSNITFDSTVTLDAGVVAGITSLTATSITGTLATAAQTNITSLGTLTALQIDNLNLNGNVLSSTSGNINITPVAGSNITFDSTVTLDAGVVAGITSLTTTAATVNNSLTVNGSALSTGDLTVNAETSGVAFFVDVSGADAALGLSSVTHTGNYRTMAIGGGTGGGIIDFVNNSAVHLAQVYSNSAGALTLDADPANLVASSAIKFSIDGAEKVRIDASGNLGILTTSFGAGAVGVLAIANGTQGAAAANMVQMVSSDISAGNTTLSVQTEGTSSATGRGDATADGYITIKWNGATHYILTKSAAW